jgi:hypothetical protein
MVARLRHFMLPEFVVPSIARPALILAFHTDVDWRHVFVGIGFVRLTHGVPFLALSYSRPSATQWTRDTSKAEPL